MRFGTWKAPFSDPKYFVHCQLCFHLTSLKPNPQKQLDIPPQKNSAAHGCFQKLGTPQNGWFIMENPIEMDDLGVPLFSDTPT